jgi:hypothetical protein
MTRRHSPLFPLRVGALRRLAGVVLAATLPLVAIACGATVPTKPEAAAAV